jgi:uncharacterized protein (DUF1015 family)
MPRVFPFDALRYDPAVVGDLELVTAPPYDVISDARRREYQQRSPFNVVHLDLADDTEAPAHPADRFQRAGRLIVEWREVGARVRAGIPSYFADEMRFSLDGTPGRVRGLICAMQLEDWGPGVLPHERTMPGPIEDRLGLLRATRTHLSAVYGTIAGPNAALAELLAHVCSTEPSSALVDEQGVEHGAWPIPEREPLAAWLSGEPLLIADGHHRYATALRYRRERDRDEGPGPWDRLLTFVVDAGSERVPVLPFHRIQVGGDVPAVGRPASGLDDVLRAISDEDVVVGLVTREKGGLLHRTVRLTGEPPAVCALHEGFLGAANDEGALRFTPDPAEAEGAVRSGEAVAAWLLPPTTPDRIRAVVGRGERFPPKSTYFWPKPRTGMVMMPLDPS